MTSGLGRAVSRPKPMRGKAALVDPALQAELVQCLEAWTGRQARHGCPANSSVPSRRGSHGYRLPVQLCRMGCPKS
ncbi:hypothetical protein G6F57_022094 [Rhizopus arrhizus]|nr:hypothetical protein G6F57_022094 [Rhizopus arrhizus]